MVMVVLLVILGILIGCAVAFFLGFVFGRAVGGKKPGPGFPVLRVVEAREPPVAIGRGNEPQRGTPA